MSFRRIGFSSAALLLSAHLFLGQQEPPHTVTPAVPPQLSPKAAYDDAMHPLDETRRSIGNWSGAEMSALKVTLDRARTACQARNAHTFSGADLIEFARLCALGQEWGTVVLATSLYIDEPGAAKPQLADAHAARVDADLHLRSEPDALRDAHAMFAAVPYSPIVAEASTETIEYMRFSAPDDALALAAEREHFVLDQMRTAYGVVAAKQEGGVPAAVNKASAGSAPADSTAPSTATKLSIHELYAQGLALATLLQQANRAAPAQEALAALDAALPGTLGPDDSLRIADERQRYALLGKPLPAVTPTRSLSMPYVLPAIPAVNTVTALVLFPDWCAQCISSVAQLPETVSAVEGHSAYYYGLLAETVPEKAPPAKQSRAEIFSAFQPGYAAALLAEKPVVTVPSATTVQFRASDYPFLVITDAKGIVRVAQAVDADDLSSGGKMDSAVLLVSKHWPLPSLVPTPAKAGGGDGASIQ